MSESSNAECLKFEKLVLLKKYMTTDIINQKILGEKKKHECSTGEAVRILFDAYVADLIECSFSLHPTPDREDGDQQNEYHQ